ncbi:WXG100-like domain-containing protein [Nocardia gamkensis]|uniref:WXG100-like domain-containing protein n=1 Tax=Nocardia gamkensis TaxID=352869 RepID=UPI0037C5CED1
MSIELPSEVALFLNCIGVPYPDVNEDDVRALGKYVSDFANSVAGTHDLATGTITELGAVYSGESYEALVAAWARMSASHMRDLDKACHIVAGALDVAADVITAVKIAVLAELAALAASYAVVLATPGAVGYTLAVREVTRRVCQGMEDMLLSYIVAEVIGKAIEPLEDTIGRLINGTVREAAREVLGVPRPGHGAVPTLYIEPDEVLRYAKVLDDLADDILGHATTFAANVANLDFTTPDRVHMEPLAAQPGSMSGAAPQTPPSEVYSGTPDWSAGTNALREGASSSVPQTAIDDDSRYAAPAHRRDYLQPAGALDATVQAPANTVTRQPLSSSPEIVEAQRQVPGRMPSEFGPVLGDDTPDLLGRSGVVAASHSTPDSVDHGRTSATEGDYGRTTMADAREVESVANGVGHLDGFGQEPRPATDTSTAWSALERTGMDSMALPTPWAPGGQAVPEKMAVSLPPDPKPSKSPAIAATSHARKKTPWSMRKRGLTKHDDARKVFAPPSGTRRAVDRHEPESGKKSSPWKDRRGSGSAVSGPES